LAIADNPLMGDHSAPHLGVAQIQSGPKTAINQFVLAA